MASSSVSIMEVLTEVQRITQSSNPYKTAITAGLSGSIRPGLLRSLYWRIFLGLLSAPRSKPSDSSALLEQWEEEVHELRKAYALTHNKRASSANLSVLEAKAAAEAAKAKKKSRFGDSDESDEDAGEAIRKDNPLSSEKGSAYAKAFQRKKLEETIDKDLGRLWSDDPFFDSELVKDMMRSILMDYCDEEREGEEGHIAGYRQGMHEILSLILYVVHRDAEFVHSLKPKLSDLNEEQESDWSIVQALFAPAAVIQDSNMIFIKMMTFKKGLGLVTWYHGTVGSPSASSPLSSASPNIVVDVANDVQLTLLKQADEALWKTLNKTHDIQATSYLLRWLRLLFLREFSFSQSSQLWDAILAEYSWRVSEEDEEHTYTLSDSIVPHIAVSMLLYVSEDLQNSEYSFALRRLMRYPPVEDIRPIVRKSIERRHRGARLALIAGILSHHATTASQSSSLASQTIVAQEAALLSGAPLLPPPRLSAASSGPTTPSGAPPPPLQSSSGTTARVLGTAAPPPLAASFGGPQASSGSAGAAVRAAFVSPETTGTLRDKQIRQGMALASIIRRMEGKWFAPAEQTEAEKAAAEEDYLVAIAELKRVRDVLLGSVPE